MQKYTFPKDFVWGTATASYQIEGDNRFSDWWQAEIHRPDKLKEHSAEGCDSYNRYEEDFDLAKKLNNNGIRISLEWARIEPEEGVFNEQELEHYKKVLQAARQRGLQTFVTLHHFTNPMWIYKKGHWANIKTPKYFARYAKKVGESLGSEVDVFLTINEPQVYALMGYVLGNWPPFSKNYFKSLIVQINFMRAHVLAYKELKKINTHYTVGIVKNIVWYETKPKGAALWDKCAVKFLNFIGRDFFLLPISKQLDLIGLNYYFTNRIVNLKQSNPNTVVSDLGWWINPEGLGKILNSLKRYKVPVYITENGVADAQDKLRVTFIQEHLEQVAKAIENGANVRGYFHWSLIDNFEWAEGYWPRFGLVEIDRTNGLERKPRKSFDYYAKVCKTGEVEL